MIIWINGSFGAGKSTAATLLNRKVRNSIVYDPEKIGAFLRDTMPFEANDFQDYKLWRILSYEVLKNLSEKYKHVIVPMTLVDSEYYEEIIGRLEKSNVKVKHIILSADKQTLIKRLDERINTTEWAYNQIERCIQGLSELKGEIVKTDNLSVDQVIDKINNIISAEIK